MCGNGLKFRFVTNFVNTTNHHVGVSFEHSRLPKQNQGVTSWICHFYLYHGMSLRCSAHSATLHDFVHFWESLELLFPLIVILQSFYFKDGGVNGIHSQDQLCIALAEGCRCCVLKGGIQALRSASSSASTDNLQFLSRYACEFAVAKVHFKNCIMWPSTSNVGVCDSELFQFCMLFLTLVCLIYRDAVALLLQRKEGITEAKNLGASVPHLIDVRRHDERVLYGNIKGSLHIQGIRGLIL